jgi:Tat protein translocase TatB subunit
MDSFFGIGLPELLVILVLAGLVMGPQRIRIVARWLGTFVAQMQRLSRDFSRQLNEELDALDQQEVREALEEVKTLRKQVRDLRKEVLSLPKETAGEAQRALDEAKQPWQVGKKPLANGTTNQPGSTESPAGLPKAVRVPDDPET